MGGYVNQVIYLGRVQIDNISTANGATISSTSGSDIFTGIVKEGDNLISSTNFTTDIMGGISTTFRPAVGFVEEVDTTNGTITVMGTSYGMAASSDSFQLYLVLPSYYINPLFGKTHADSKTITNIEYTSNVTYKAGDRIYAKPFKPGTYVTAVDTASITVSTPALTTHDKVIFLSVPHNKELHTTSNRLVTTIDSDGDLNLSLNNELPYVAGDKIYFSDQYTGLNAEAWVCTRGGIFGSVDYEPKFERCWPSGIAELTDRVTALEDTITHLETEIANCCSSSSSSSFNQPNSNFQFHDLSVGECSSNLLYQNRPNPFVEKTTIMYEFDHEAKNRKTVITDKSGREIKNYPIKQCAGTIEVFVAELPYVDNLYYSLIADGRIINTKQMRLQRN